MITAILLTIITAITVATIWLAIELWRAPELCEECGRDPANCDCWPAAGRNVVSIKRREG